MSASIIRGKKGGILVLKKRLNFARKIFTSKMASENFLLVGRLFV